MAEQCGRRCSGEGLVSLERQDGRGARANSQFQWAAACSTAGPVRFGSVRFGAGRGPWITSSLHLRCRNLSQETWRSHLRVAGLVRSCGSSVTGRWVTQAVTAGHVAATRSQDKSRSPGAQMSLGDSKNTQEKENLQEITIPQNEVGA